LKLGIVAGCFLLVLSSFSCVKYVGPNEKYSVQDILNDNIPDNLSGQSVFSNDTIVHYGGITITPLFGDNVTGPADKNWISPGKVFVSGIYPGGKATYFVKIHNGKDKDSIFSVIARNVDRFDSGYNKNLPLSWISIDNVSPLVKAGEVIVIPIYVEIPSNYKGNYQEKMEFLISVIDTGRGGNVIIELCSKWLITTK
jgi:hypothetical protein